MASQDVFRKTRYIIIFVNKIFGFFPRFIFSYTWPILELLPWKLGIALRYIWAKRLAKSCGDNVVFETGVRVTYWEEIELGNNVSIFETCYIDAKGGVRIGDNVSIAHQCSLITFDFDMTVTDVPLKYAPMIKQPIDIGDNCLIFSGVRIFAGVKLAPRSVVAANAVLKAGTYESGLYAGLPAVRKKAVG